MSDPDRISALEDEVRKLRELMTYLRPANCDPGRWWHNRLDVGIATEGIPVRLPQDDL